jgi:hypothetical protein
VGDEHEAVEVDRRVGAQDGPQRQGDAARRRVGRRDGPGPPRDAEGEDEDRRGRQPDGQPRAGEEEAGDGDRASPGAAAEAVEGAGETEEERATGGPEEDRGRRGRTARAHADLAG